MNKQNMMDNVRVVLSHTSHPGNIGAAARAMKTMGLRHLYLINPKHFPDPQANSLAAGADDLLAQAVVCDSLDAALQDVVLTVGMTARLRDISLEVKTPRAAMPEVVQRAQHAPVALLFGTEMSGLSNEELMRAQVLINIPTNPDFSSLNVAAAVQVLCYELSVAAEAFQPAAVPGEALASHQQLEGYFGHLEQTLTEIGFFTSNNPERMMQRLRRLYARARLEADEVHILRGILSVTRSYNARLKKRYQDEHGT